MSPINNLVFLFGTAPTPGCSNVTSTIDSRTEGKSSDTVWCEFRNTGTVRLFNLHTENKINCSFGAVVNDELPLFNGILLNNLSKYEQADQGLKLPPSIYWRFDSYSEDSALIYWCTPYLKRHIPINGRKSMSPEN